MRVPADLVARERAALQVFFDATGGKKGWTWRKKARWQRYDGWRTSKPLESWHGVRIHTSGRVDVLELSWNNLSGSVPGHIGQLSMLTKLILRHHDLSGEIPRELGQLSALTELDMRSNRLTGRIPPELGNLVSLTYLNFSSNLLSGPIPSQIGKLTALEKVTFQKNGLTGPIPWQIGRLTTLTKLDLSENALSGYIPPEMGQLCALQDLSIEGNDLTGHIPREFGRLSRLTRLSVDDDKITGRPESWESLAEWVERLDPDLLVATQGQDYTVDPDPLSLPKTSEYPPSEATVADDLHSPFVPDEPVLAPSSGDEYESVSEDPTDAASDDVSIISGDDDREDPGTDVVVEADPEPELDEEHTEDAVPAYRDIFGEEGEVVEIQPVSREIISETRHTTAPSEQHAALDLVSDGERREENRVDTFRTQLAPYPRLDQLTAENRNVLDDVMHFFEIQPSAPAAVDDECIVPTMQEGDLKELEKLVTKASVLEKLVTNASVLEDFACERMEDISMQRREQDLSLLPLQGAYQVTIRSGLCSVYLAASVVSSNFVPTTKTGKFGAVGKAVKVLAGAAPMIPGLPCVAAIFEAGDRLYQTGRLVALTRLANDAMECCELARKVALILAEKKPEDTPEEFNNSGVSMPGHLPEVSGPDDSQDAHQEDVVDWLVNEVAGYEDGDPMSDERNHLAKKGRRMGKCDLKTLLKAVRKVPKGCLEDCFTVDDKVKALVEVIHPAVTVATPVEKIPVEDTPPESPAPVVPSVPLPPLPARENSEAVDSLDLSMRLEDVVARLADFQASQDARLGTLSRDVEDISSKVDRGAEFDAGGGQSLKQAVVQRDIEAFWEQARQQEFGTQKNETDQRMELLKREMDERFGSMETFVLECMRAFPGRRSFFPWKR